MYSQKHKVAFSPGDNYTKALTIAGVDTLRSRRDSWDTHAAVLHSTCTGREILSPLSAATEARWENHSQTQKT